MPAGATADIRNEIIQFQETSMTDDTPLHPQSTTDQAASLHIAAQLPCRARSAKSIRKVTIELGFIGSIHLEPDAAHTLVHQLQSALHALTAGNTEGI